jgi:ABC-type sulfate transport system permease component
MMETAILVLVAAMLAPLAACFFLTGCLLVRELWSALTDREY